MGSKRKREVSQPKLSKKQKKKLAKQQKEGFVPLENSFNPLHKDSSDEDDNVYDFNKLKNDIVLDDYDYSDEVSSDEVVVGSDKKDNDGSDVSVEIESDSDSVVVDLEDNGDDEVVENDDESDQPPKKIRKHDNELTGNKDFIGFGFESSDDENDKQDEEYSDDGLMSNDEGDVLTNSKPSSLYPWIKAHDHSKQKEIADWLTMEIKDFINYISPSKQEIITRNAVVVKLKASINKCWPDATAHVFGSYATDLYLPGSDIDMVVVSKNGDCENRHKLYQLSSFLRQNKLAKDIEVIAGAKVPIIKFVEPESNIQIDISFERTNGIDAAKRISKWISNTKGLREIVMVIKQFLRSRKLNNVHVGGLGGYATIILCYHFLKLHPRVASNNMNILDNLGSLLIEFFELYGRNFSYDNLILAIDPVTDLPKYLKKAHHWKLITSKNPFSLVVQDPSDPENNITRSSYNLRDIKKAFGGAYQLLTDKCYKLNSSSYKGRIGQLILGDIIKFRGKERDFNDDRDLVVNHALVEHKNEVSQDEVIIIDDNDEDEDEDNNNDDAGEDNDNDDVVIDEDKSTPQVKEYYSEVTIDSEEESVSPLDNLVDQDKAKINSTKGESQSPAKKISDYLSIDEESDSEAEMKANKPKSLDKEAKRDYWRQKGLEL